MSNRKVGYYIYYETNTDFAGVKKKIDNQIAVLNTQFDCRKIIVPKEKKNIMKSILWRLPFGSFGRKYEYALDVFEKGGAPDFVYVRFVPMDRRFLKFIRTIRLRYPNAKLLLEIATYPYTAELLRNVTMLPFYFKDKVYQRKLKDIVDRVVTYSHDDNIFKIPTIKTRNGLIVAEQSMIQGHGDDGVIRLLAVAILQKAHGYERCIEGLAEYYRREPDRIVEIHIVGDGKELNYYQRLVSYYHLEKYVVFHGRKFDKELDKIYNMADLALGIFGLYKNKTDTISSLKSVEYLAKGLPVISGCVEDVMKCKGGESFFQIFPNDTSVIDINQVVDFYDRSYNGGIDRSNIHQKIRDFAGKTVDMAVVMQPIMRYIDE